VDLPDGFGRSSSVEIFSVQVPPFVSSAGKFLLVGLISDGPTGRIACWSGL